MRVPQNQRQTSMFSIVSIQYCILCIQVYDVMAVSFRLRVYMCVCVCVHPQAVGFIFTFVCSSVESERAQLPQMHPHSPDPCRDTDHAPGLLCSPSYRNLPASSSRCRKYAPEGGRTRWSDREREEYGHN